AERARAAPRHDPARRTRADPRRRPRDGWHGGGDRRAAGRAPRRRGGRLLLHHRADLPERPRAAVEIRLARPNRVLNSGSASGLKVVVSYNLLSARLELGDSELSDLAALEIQSGEWPWSFFCYPEEQPRPVFPSSFFLLAPGDGSLGLAVRCPVCQRTSVNLV